MRSTASGASSTWRLPRATEATSATVRLLPERRSGAAIVGCVAGLLSQACGPGLAAERTYTTNVRRLPDPTSRLLVDADGKDRLGGAVPSPAAAFLLTLISLPTLFWLVTLKRTTGYTLPELSLMNDVVPAIRDWVEHTLPPLHALLLGISALGSGWFVTLGFALLGLLALAKGRRDLALILAAGTLAFPIEWALKFFTAIPAGQPRAAVHGDLQRQRHRARRPGRLPCRPCPACHRLLRPGGVLRGPPGARPAAGDHRVPGGADPHRLHQPDPHLPGRPLPDRRAGRLDRRRGAAVGHRQRPRAGRRRAAARLRPHHRPTGRVQPHKVAVPLHHPGDADR